MKLTKLTTILEPFGPIVAMVVVTSATFYLRQPFTAGQTVGTAMATGSPTSWDIITETEG